MAAWSYKKFNLLKASGVSSILGIDITGSRAHIVELRNQAGLWNKYWSKFSVSNYFTVEFAPEFDNQAKVSCIRQALVERGIKTQYASSTIQTHGVRAVIADIPSSVTDTRAWIGEHFEKLLRVPALLKDITFGYEVLSHDESTQRVEITFVRNEDIKQAQSFFSLLGLTLLSLTGDVRDALNPLLYNDEFLKSERFSFGYVIGEEAVVFDYESRKRVRTTRVDRQAQELTSPSGISIAGEVEGHDANHIQPFSIPSKYMLAVGCALKGWIEELHPIDFLSADAARLTQESLDKRLFQRVVIVCGLVIALFLGAETVGAIIVDHFQEKSEATFLESGVNYSELAVLEKQNRELKDELSKTGSLAYRSNIAGLLHELALQTPDGVWLKKFRIDGKLKPIVKISIEGYAQSGDAVALMLKQLGVSQMVKDVHLVKSGLPSENDNLGTLSLHVSHPVTFELQASLR